MNDDLLQPDDVDPAADDGTEHLADDAGLDDAVIGVDARDSEGGEGVAPPE